MKISLKAILILTSLIFIQCKKDKAVVKYSDVSIIVLNQPFGVDSTTSYSRSYGFDRDGVNTSTDKSDYEYYLTSYNLDSDDKELLFWGNNNRDIIVDEEETQLIKKYEFGSVINFGNEVTTRGYPTTEGIVLSDAETSLFQLNSTQYIGLSFGGTNGYHGWIKIKTLNNYHSCIIEAFAIAKEAGLPIKIDY